MPMKSLIYMKELCSQSLPLEQNPEAKPLVCIGLKRTREHENSFQGNKGYF